MAQLRSSSRAPVPVAAVPIALLLVLAVTVVQSAAATRVLPSSSNRLAAVWQIFSGEEEKAAEECGPQLSIETPSCKVVEKKDGYELRSYPKGQVWVKTVVANSSYSVSTAIGFYRCFYFISGENDKKQEIEMTAPVLIKPDAEANGWDISFFAPSRFSSANDLPKPTNSEVEIVEAESTVHAVFGPFGGFPYATEYNKKWQQLKSKLDRDGLKYDESSVVYAGYSSPFEIFSRKQEVHVILKK